MAIPKPEIGLVIHFAYLWRHEFEETRREGVKDRPCVVLHCVPNGLTYVCPITHRAPTDPSDAIEIPARVKAHLRLDDLPSWIMVRECNAFQWPSLDIRQTRESAYAYGFLPPRLMDRVRRAFVAKMKTQGAAVTPRTNE